MIGHLRRRPSAFGAALAAFIIVILVAAPQAQQAPAFSPGGNGGAASGIDSSTPTDIDLLVGRSAVLNVGAPIARVSLTVPDIADALVTAPGQLLIHGKTPGTISLFVWDKGGAIKTYEVNVRRDLSALSEQLKQLFPGEMITVVGSGKDVVLSGTVASKYVIEKAAEVAGGYVEKKENVVNLLKQQEGVASNQVMLRVRFAEVSRSALQELGASFVASAYKNDWFGRTTTQQFPAPAWDQDGKLVFSDFLNLFLFNSKEGLGGVVKALQTKGLFQSLAEPNLIATNGKEASFLAGGEYPYPVVQPGGSGTSISIQFKEFGIRLTFTPTVLGGDLINLKVRPEVSALDFSNALTVSGFRVPALTSRRTETEVELRDGQTFAIAGLMNNTVTSTMSKIPGIGDIPVLGLLFQSKAHQKNQTELVVMITPTIVRRGQMGVSEGLPNPVEPYMGAPDKSVPNPAAYVGSPRYPVTQPSTRPGGADAPAPVTPSAPASAAKPEAKPKPDPKPATPAKPAKSEAAEKSSAPVVPSRPVPSTPGPMAPPPASMPLANMPVTSKPVTSAPPAGPPPAASGMMAPPSTPLPSTPSQGAGMGSPYDSAPAHSSSPVSPHAAAPAAKPITKEQARLIEKAKEQEKKAAEAEARERAAAEKKKSEEDAAAQKKADVDKRQADKLARERAAREAEVAKRNDEAARRQNGPDDKREKALNDAAARLKQAQAEYEEELQKAKGGETAPKTATAKPGSPSSRQ
jgi:pilus assembly protein CpaC